MNATEPYQPRNHIRIVTAASLFDGHDAAINIMRRILQARWRPKYRPMNQQGQLISPMYLRSSTETPHARQGAR